MDWPAVIQPFLIEDKNRPSFFKYLSRDEPSSESLVLISEVTGDTICTDRRELTQGDPTKGISDTGWEEWFKDYQDIFDKRGESERKPGYQILLSCRPKPAEPEKTLPNGKVTPELAAGLECLPFSRARWSRVVNAFSLHNAIRKALVQGKCYSTSLGSWSPESEPIEMYTAVMTSEFANNLAVSSTYFAETRQTLAVIYGCNPEQMERVERLLRGSPEVHSHPMLVIGLFAELQCNRLDGLVRALEDDLENINDELQLRQDDVPEDRRNLSWAASLRIGRFRQDAKKVEEEARIIKQELEYVADTLKTWSEQEGKLANEGKHVNDGTLANDGKSANGGKSANDGKSTNGGKSTKEKREDFYYETSMSRFHGRFRELMGEVDLMMARCRDGFLELAYTYDMFRGESTKMEAKRASDLAHNSTVLATVATIFLPAATAAAVFAMPVFDFKNGWNDITWHRDKSSDEPDEGGTSATASTKAPQPVISGYFWLYIVFVFFLTCLISWYFWYKDHKRKKKAGIDLESQGGQEKPRRRNPCAALKLSFPRWRAAGKSKG